MSFKKYLAASALGFFLIFIPTQAQAVTDETEYRAVLISLISLLQKQVVLLQAELGQSLEVKITKSDLDSGKQDQSLVKTVDPDENSTFQSLVDIVAKYQISEVRDVEKIKEKKQREHLSYFFDLLPEKYDKKFSELIVFSGDDVEFDAFVETVTEYKNEIKTEEWTYAIREEIIEKPDLYADTELMIHELGHVVSYETVSSIDSNRKVCSSYLGNEYCYSSNSYLGQFADEFWGDLNSRSLDDSYEFYEDNQTEFVSDYAATNPAEDFSEVFMYFVLDKPVEGSGAEEKIDFLSDFSELVQLKKEVQENIRF